MVPYVLSPAAQIDIEQIWDYTAENWSETQAETYVLAIREALERVAKGEIKARSAEDIRPGYYKIISGSHLILFRRNNSTIEVVRILHQRMDSTQLE